jgi:hypothetical protein
MDLESPTDCPCPAYNRRDVLDPRKTQRGCSKQVDIWLINTASRHGVTRQKKIRDKRYCTHHW